MIEFEGEPEIQYYVNKTKALIRTNSIRLAFEMFLS